MSACPEKTFRKRNFRLKIIEILFYNKRITGHKPVYVIRILSNSENIITFCRYRCNVGTYMLRFNFFIIEFRTFRLRNFTNLTLLRKIRILFCFVFFKFCAGGGAHLPLSNFSRCSSNDRLNSNVSKLFNVFQFVGFLYNNII